MHLSPGLGARSTGATANKYTSKYTPSHDKELAGILSDTEPLDGKSTTNYTAIVGSLLEEKRR